MGTHVHGPFTGPCSAIRMKALELMSRAWGLTAKSSGNLRWISVYLSQGHLGPQEGYPTVSRAVLPLGACPARATRGAHSPRLGDLRMKSVLPVSEQTETTGMIRVSWGSEANSPLTVCPQWLQGVWRTLGPEAFPVIWHCLQLLSSLPWFSSIRASYL